MGAKNTKMRKSLRYKILFVLIPFFLISFSFLGITIYYSTNNGITSIAKEFIGYRLQEVLQFYQEQSAQKLALMNTELSVSFDEINATLEYAQKFDQEDFLIIPNDLLPTQTFSTNFSSLDFQNVRDLVARQESIGLEDPQKWNSWITFTAENKQDYVGIFIPNVEAQAWFVLLSNKKNFYEPVDTVMYYVMLIVSISLVVMIVLILLFVNFLTKPLSHSIDTIKSITDNMDFSQRVRIQYQDEIGLLGQYFNNMIEELEKSYNQIKNYAYQTVLAKHKEEQIRYIFQKYVPKDVIDQVLNRTSDSLLVGAKQTVTVLFSDIRSFTTISEMLNPEELVLSLNAYFTDMVDQIIRQQGIIDKFIGDAIMAIFGAPLRRPFDADNAILASLGMVKALEAFNNRQLQKGKITFEIGIGLNTGEAIVGNIGSEQKVDYTVIGDPVNLGSRLEGLTKAYKVPILISEFTKTAVVDQERFLFFNIDTVRVKGKAFPVKIYEPIEKSSLSSEKITFYTAFHLAQEEYYHGVFDKALPMFQRLKQQPFTHYIVDMYIERCEYLIKNPPHDWDGVETWKVK